jgi:hypothetical protein
MMSEYDPTTGASKRPNETDEQRADREKRERAGVGQPQAVDAEADVSTEQQRAAEQRKRDEAERKARGEGTGYVSREDAPDA